MNDFNHYRGRGRGAYQHKNFRGAVFNNARRPNPNAFSPLLPLQHFRDNNKHRWQRPHHANMWRGGPPRMPPYMRPQMPRPLFQRPPVDTRPVSPLPGSEEARQKVIAEASARIKEQLNLDENGEGLVKNMNIDQPVPCLNNSEDRFDEDCTVVYQSFNDNNQILNIKPPERNLKRRTKKPSFTEPNKSVEELRNKILTQFTCMSKGKIQSLVNNPGSSKYDGYLQHLVRDMRLHLSSELRNMYNNRESTTENNEMIDHFNSIIPDLGVELVSLPDTMVAELSKILQFDMNTDNDIPVSNLPLNINDNDNALVEPEDMFKQAEKLLLNTDFLDSSFETLNQPAEESQHSFQNVNSTFSPDSTANFLHNSPHSIRVDHNDPFMQRSPICNEPPPNLNFDPLQNHFIPHLNQIPPQSTNFIPEPNNFIPQSSIFPSQPSNFTAMGVDLIETADMDIDDTIDENVTVASHQTPTDFTIDHDSSSNLDEIPLPDSNLQLEESSKLPTLPNKLKTPVCSRDSSPFSKKILEANMPDSTNTLDPGLNFNRIRSSSIPASNPFFKSPSYSNSPCSARSETNDSTIRQVNTTEKSQKLIDFEQIWLFKSKPDYIRTIASAEIEPTDSSTRQSALEKPTKLIDFEPTNITNVTSFLDDVISSNLCDSTKSLPNMKNTTNEFFKSNSNSNKSCDSPHPVLEKNSKLSKHVPNVIESKINNNKNNKNKARKSDTKIESPPRSRLSLDERIKMMMRMQSSAKKSQEELDKEKTDEIIQQQNYKKNTKKDKCLKMEMRQQQQQQQQKSQKHGVSQHEKIKVKVHVEKFKQNQNNSNNQQKIQNFNKQNKINNFEDPAQHIPVVIKQEKLDLDETTDIIQNQTQNINMHLKHEKVFNNSTKNETIFPTKNTAQIISGNLEDNTVQRSVIEIRKNLMPTKAALKDLSPIKNKEKSSKETENIISKDTTQIVSEKSGVIENKILDLNKKIEYRDIPGVRIKRKENISDKENAEKVELPQIAPINREEKTDDPEVKESDNIIQDNQEEINKDETSSSVLVNEAQEKENEETNPIAPKTAEEIIKDQGTINKDLNLIKMEQDSSVLIKNSQNQDKELCENTSNVVIDASVKIEDTTHENFENNKEKTVSSDVENVPSDIKLTDIQESLNKSEENYEKPNNISENLSTTVEQKLNEPVAKKSETFDSETKTVSVDHISTDDLNQELHENNDFKSKEIAEEPKSSLTLNEDAKDTPTNVITNETVTTSTDKISQDTTETEITAETKHCLTENKIKISQESLINDSENIPDVEISKKLSKSDDQKDRFKSNERAKSIERSKSIERAKSIERGKSIDRGKSIERAKSYERKDSKKTHRGNSVERIKDNKHKSSDTKMEKNQKSKSKDNTHDKNIKIESKRTEVHSSENTATIEVDHKCKQKSKLKEEHSKNKHRDHDKKSPKSNKKSGNEEAIKTSHDKNDKPTHVILPQISTHQQEGICIPQNETSYQSSVINRLMEIDLQIQKLMQEKWDLYKQLNVGNISNTLTYHSAISEPVKIENQSSAKEVIEKREQITENIKIRPVSTTPSETSTLSEYSKKPFNSRAVSLARSESSLIDLDEKNRETDEENEIIQNRLPQKKLKKKKSTQSSAVSNSRNKRKLNDDDSDIEVPKKLRKNISGLKKLSNQNQDSDSECDNSIRKKEKLDKKSESKRNEKSLYKAFKLKTKESYEEKNVAKKNIEILERNENLDNEKEITKKNVNKSSKTDIKENTNYQDAEKEVVVTEETNYISYNEKKSSKKRKKKTDTNTSVTEDITEEPNRKFFIKIKKPEKKLLVKPLSEIEDKTVETNPEAVEMKLNSEKVKSKKHKKKQNDEIIKNISTENVEKPSIETERTNNNREETLEENDAENFNNNNESEKEKTTSEYKIKGPENSNDNKSIKLKIVKSEIKIKDDSIDESNETSTSLRRSRRITTEENTSQPTENMLIAPTSIRKKKTRKTDEDTVRRSRSRSASKENDLKNPKSRKIIDSSDEEDAKSLSSRSSKRKQNWSESETSESSHFDDKIRNDKKINAKRKLSKDSNISVTESLINKSVPDLLVKTCFVKLERITLTDNKKSPTTKDDEHKKDDTEDISNEYKHEVENKEICEEVDKDIHEIIDNLDENFDDSIDKSNIFEKDILHENKDHDSFDEPKDFTDEVFKGYDKTNIPEGIKINSDVSTENQDAGIYCSGHRKSILDIKIIGDEFLAASEDGTIYKYCLKTGDLQDAYTGHKRAVTCMNVMSGRILDIDSTIMYSGSLDCTLKCYNIDTAEVLHSVTVEQAIQCMDSAWGYIFLGTYEGLLFIYNIKKKLLNDQSLTIANATVLMIKATQEGSRQVLILASRKREIMVRDAFTGLLLRTMCQDQKPTIYSLLLDRSMVYCGTSDKGILILDFNNGMQTGVYNSGKGVVCLVMYKTLLFAGCYDGMIYIYNTKTQKHIITVPGPGEGMLLSLAISHGMVIAGTKKDHLLKIWKIPQELLNQTD